MLNTNNNLRDLNLKSNLLGNNSANAILETLTQSNRIILKIDLSLNKIAFSIIEQINHKLHQNEQNYPKTMVDFYDN